MSDQEPPFGGFLTVQLCSVRRAEPDSGSDLLHQPTKETAVKKKQPYKPKQQTSVVVRKNGKSDIFKDALSKANGHRGRPAVKLEEITKALGDDHHLFIESCCRREVTTSALAQAVRAIGVNISYATMLRIRKDIEAENKWFYEMVQNIVSNGGTEEQPPVDDWSYAEKQ